MGILSIDKLVPWLARLSSNKIIVVVVQGKAILVNVGEKVICSQNFSNFYKLVVVVATLEEWFLLENHSSEHAT